jgi:hypothetical protein
MGRTTRVTANEIIYEIIILHESSGDAAEEQFSTHIRVNRNGVIIRWVFCRQIREALLQGI